MTRAPILFRVDGTRRHGWESLWRCLTYAAALQRRRRPTYFLSQLDPSDLAQPIKRIGNEWIEALSPAGCEDDLAQTVQEIHRLSPAAVIVDSTEATEDYLQTLRETGALLVSLDHLAQVALASQLIVNPLLGPGRESYE